MKRLVVIDGKSVFYRGYYAMPGLSMHDGTPTGGVFGFASLALEIIKKLEPDYVAVAWDKKGTSIRRRLELLPTYKAGRKKPAEDFFVQIPLLHELLDAFNWPLYEFDDYEADDIMGALALQASREGIETCLITSDLDMLQLVGPLTHVYALKKGFTDIEQFNIEYFEQKYGIRVHQFVDLKALKGDSSDNIPGVPGIGEKTGVQLLQEYATLDGIYEHLDEIKPTIAKKLGAGKELAYLSKEVAEIWCDAPLDLDLEAMDAHKLDAGKLASLLKKFEFSSLVRRLPQHMKETTQQTNLFDSLPPATSFKGLQATTWSQERVIKPASEVVLHIVEETVWISLDRETAMSVPINSLNAAVVTSMKEAKLIAYDVKSVYHMVHNLGVELQFKDVHDIAQAAFLLDPLSRDRSLTALVKDHINMDDPLQVTAALWRVYDEQVEAFVGEPKIANIAHQLDFPLAYMLYRMEAKGIKINSAFLATMSQELGDEHAQLEQEMYDAVGSEFNIASPTQLSEVLFTKLQLPTTGIKKGKTGYSTGQKELDKLRGLHPIIELIERTRELAKLKNTYIDTLPLLMDGNARVHTTFNQDVASTGRLSSTNPNLQNIPVRTDLGRKIREAFIPEEGNVFVSADYSQFELRLAAALANDTKLIADFNSGIDIHTKTASEAYGIPVEDVSKKQRRAAKVINFGVLYGMSPHGLSAATEMNFSEAKDFIDRYFTVRAPIRLFMDATLEKAQTEGYVETLLGRRRPTPDVNSANFMVREGAKRAAINMPIQGTEADLMKLAMLKVDQELGGLGEQVLQIHDSILIECPRENAEHVSQILRKAMEGIAPDLGVKLDVDVSVGDNWGDL